MSNFYKSVFLLLLLLCIFRLSEGSVLKYHNYLHDDLSRSRSCLDMQSGREFRVGEVYYRPGQCVHVQCLADLTLWENRCKVPRLVGDCVEIPPSFENRLQKYPKCCPLYQCHKILDNGNFEEKHVYDQHGNIISTNIKRTLTVNADEENRIRFIYN